MFHQVNEASIRNKLVELPHRRVSMGFARVPNSFLQTGDPEEIQTISFLSQLSDIYLKETLQTACIH